MSQKRIESRRLVSGTTTPLAVFGSVCVGVGGSGCGCGCGCGGEEDACGGTPRATCRALKDAVSGPTPAGGGRTTACRRSQWR